MSIYIIDLNTKLCFLIRKKLNIKYTAEETVKNHQVFVNLKREFQISQGFTKKSQMKSENKLNSIKIRSQ